MDFLIVGLGNPGKEYENTRHNIGFMVMNSVAEKYNLLSFQNRFRSECGQIEIGTKKVILLKPQTYMNLSGSAVLSTATFYKIPLNRIFVIHDDLDLILGRLKFKIGGSSGGHNGLKSLDSIMGSNYYRLRFGISHPGGKNNVSNFVLSKFKKDEEVIINTAIKFIANHVELLLKDDSASFFNEYAKVYKPFENAEKGI